MVDPILAFADELEYDEGLGIHADRLRQLVTITPGNTLSHQLQRRSGVIVEFRAGLPSNFATQRQIGLVWLLEAERTPLEFLGKFYPVGKYTLLAALPADADLPGETL